jgi:hypothetical protein
MLKSWDGRHGRGDAGLTRGRVALAGALATIIAISAITVSQAATAALTMETAQVHTFYPKFNTQTRDYAMYGCDKRTVTLKFSRSVRVNGKSASSFSYTGTADTAKQLTINDQGRETTHTVRCLQADFPKLEFTKGRGKLDGYLLTGFEGRDNATSGFGIFDVNGVPLWYRYNPENRTMSVPTVTSAGDLELLMRDNPAAGDKMRFEATTDTYLLRMSLDGVTRKTVKPTAQYKPIPVDYHSFATVRDGYYFLTSDVKVSNTTPQWLAGGVSPNADESAAKETLCTKASRFKEITASVVRTDNSGVVNWRMDLSGVEPPITRGAVKWVGREAGNLTCYYETHHPNWVSVDPSGKRLFVSLRNAKQTYAIDIASKRVVWKLGTRSDLAVVVDKDPAGRPGGMHSGSLNSKGEFLVFDNRESPTEIGRAVIYKVVDDKRMVFVRAFIPPKDVCTTISGSIFCPTRVMGNASFTFNGDVLVNWGDKNGNPNIVTLFDRTGAVLLDVRDPLKRQTPYKSEYVAKKLGNGREWITLDEVLKGTTAEKIAAFKTQR